MLKDRRPRKVITHRLAYGRPAAGSRKFPEKLDHFEITLATADSSGDFPVDKEAMRRLSDSEALGGKYDPVKPRRLPIRLDSDVISDVLHQQYECRVKSKRDGKLHVFCQGDGEVAERVQSDGTTKTIRCCAAPDFGDRGYADRTPRDLDALLERPTTHNPNDGLRCPFAQNRNPKDGPKCVVVTELTCRCDVVGAIGARARFRSHSHRTADQMVSSLEDIKASLPGGILAHVPLDLVMQTVTMDVPGSTAKAKQPVAHVELRLPYDKTVELTQRRLSESMQLQAQVEESRRLLQAAKTEPSDPEVVEAEWQDSAVVDDIPGSGPYKEVVNVEADDAGEPDA